MRLSTSTNLYFNRPNGRKASMTESVRRCAAAGYRVMDLNFHDCTTFALPFVTDRWEAWLGGIAETAEACGVVFGQCHLPFYNFCDRDYAGRAAMDELIRRAVRCAGKLSIPCAVIHAGTAYDTAGMRRESLRRNTEYLLPLLELADSCGVRLALENLWDRNIVPRRRFTTEPEDLLELTDRLPTAGVCYDTDHAALMGQSQTENLRLIGGRLCATHISDAINVDSDHLLPFSGTTDWGEVMRGLREIRYGGDFTYEIHRYTQGTPDALVDGALRYSVHVGNYLIGLSENGGETHAAV